MNKNRAEDIMHMMLMEMPTQVVSHKEVENFVNFDFDQFGNEFVVTETCDEHTKTITIKNINTGETIVIIENYYEI